MQGKEQLATDLDTIKEKAKQTQESFKNFEKIARPIGIALVGIGAAGLMAANATKDWNNALGDTLQKLKPVFASLTGIGVALMVATKVIKSVRIAFEALKVTAISTAGVFGLLGVAIGGVGLLIYGLTQLFPGLKADTERWNTALGKANDSLKELESNGQGSSIEANILRDAIDDLTYSLGRFNEVGEDNVVTTTNLDAAIKKLAESKKKLNAVDAGLVDMMEQVREETNFGRMMWRIYDITLGDTASDVVELTANILELKDAQIEELDTIRNDAVKVLEDYYGLRSFQTQSLMEQFEDETEAEQESLANQIEMVQDNVENQTQAYRDAYDERCRLLDLETKRVVRELQKQLDALDNFTNDTTRAREDEDDAKTEAELRATIASAWNRVDRAKAEEELAKFLEEVSRKKEDRVLEDQRASLEDQIQGIETTAQTQKDTWEQELNDQIAFYENMWAPMESYLQGQLDALQTALVTKRGILQQELNDAVTVQNQIRDNAIADINAVIAAQLAAAGTNETTTQPIAFGSGPTGRFMNAALHAAGVPGYASGGPILEPTVLSSMRTGRPYAIAGENGPERVVPGGGGITITGNTFNVRTDADIPRIASELMRMRMLKGSFGS